MTDLEDGIERFNAEAFWYAHESWEKLWLVAEGEEKDFLRAMIKLAAAYHHVQRRNWDGAVRLFDSALTVLSRYPDGYLAIDRANAVSAASRHREVIAGGPRIDEFDFPKLRYNSVLSTTQRNLTHRGV